VTAIPGLAEVHAARERLAGLAVRTPLVRHEAPELDASVYLKLENLQPAGAYKTRPAASVLGDSLDQALRVGRCHRVLERPLQAGQSAVERPSHLQGRVVAVLDGGELPVGTVAGPHRAQEDAQEAHGR